MNLEELLLRVEKPARYIGGEYGLPDVKKPHRVSFCLCFPDLYEVGMSNLGVQILYDVLNKHPDVVCERCFAPWADFGSLLRENGYPLFSLESRKPLKEFDVVGFSLQYEMCYSTLLYMLDLAGIPFYAAQRDESYPILIAGGPCSVNPEPFAPFFDAVVIGEGEEADLAIALAVADHKGDKRSLLEKLQTIEGVYVPALSDTDEGRYAVAPRVKKAVVRDFDAAPLPLHPLVPNLEIIHDRPVVELYRGCYAGCRFCQACFFYRPVRARKVDTVMRAAETLMGHTGAEELGISSLSSGDYPGIKELLAGLQPLAKECGVHLQLPSLRLDSFSEELSAGEGRKSSLTFAPEAGTQRLRDVINKNISDEDIERTMRIAFRSGYRAVKLYFMLGLPTETDEDVRGIAAIARAVKHYYVQETGRRDVRIVVSTSLFIPKPLTPFQWAAQISREEMERRVALLRQELRTVKGVDYRWHDAGTSYLEGIFARGDRRLANVLERAYQLGVKFDGWSEHFRFDLWQQALAECNVETEAYLGEKQTDERLPWDFIDFGVKREYLEKEYRLALSGVSGSSCKYGCQGCGANGYVACQVQKRG